MNKIPEIFIRRWKEEFVDDETGEKVLVDRFDVDCTFHNPELIPTLIKHVAADEADAEITIRFCVDVDILSPRIDVKKTKSANHTKRIIQVYNEESRVLEVLAALKEQYPDMHWRHALPGELDKVRCSDALFNYAPNTCYSPKLIPALMKHIASVESGSQIELYFHADKSTKKSRLEIEKTPVVGGAEEEYGWLLMIHIYNEVGRAEEVLDALKAQYPDIPWKLYKPDSIVDCYHIWNYTF